MKIPYILVGLFLGFSIADPSSIQELAPRGQKAGPACSWVAHHPKGRKVVCGEAGTLGAAEPLGKPIHAATPNVCRNSCFESGGCVSFGFDTAAKTCQMYKKFIIKQKFKRDNSSTTVFYNRRCFTKKCNVTAPKACGNQGFQWAYYQNPYGVNSDTTYSQFNPATFKTTTPVYQSVTSFIGGFYDPTIAPMSFYGSPRLSGANYTLNHRAYMFPLVTGSYAFEFSKVDDIVELWVGDLAYSGFTRQNENFETNWHSNTGSTGDGSGIFSTSLIAGRYYAVRVIMGQGIGPSSFNMVVTDPNGQVVTQSNGASSSLIMQYSCNKKTAPPYPAFGHES